MKMLRTLGLVLVGLQSWENIWAIYWFLCNFDSPQAKRHLIPSKVNLDAQVVSRVPGELKT